ncbi:hypothetical protein [Geoalkalibacter halelectricus]|uniref:Uncharacterized protein n=1 Tax=Geoalkalibacter halelectricus TaxID=2847045 RepID=A0ABY5ZNH9_9BACT|nr:hypothetical protein [Geoalkalibacter halelectricus]MDO3377098.1 hypothetical protein [Geoalkalibacter halelectricus]UWZ79405.1 hypothetical protein L9S41_17240 [Geoalkalibacter halelectricus]
MSLAEKNEMPLAILRQQQLEADSPHCARYVLRLVALREGFVVEKMASSLGRKRRYEARFYWTRREAEINFEKILRQKTRVGRKRCYRQVCFLPERQMSLFP